MPTQTETTNTPAARFHAFMEEAAVKGNRIYIAGPMTGLPDFNFPAFNYAAALLRDQGLHVENPAEHGGVDGAEWADYLRYDMGRLATCGAIYLLKGWENSKGAQLEVHVARTLGMVVMYAPGAMSVLQAELRQRPSPVLGQASELKALRKKVATYEARDALGLIPQEGKPSWSSHAWPQIVQDSSGNWYGVRDGWTMSIVRQFKGDELNLLREDGEFLQRGTPSQNWRTSLEKRPSAAPVQAVADGASELNWIGTSSHHLLPKPPAAAQEPIDMVLHCPKCGLQHIDAPDERTPGWKNEPHRSHLCHGCGHIWRPADVPTNGVQAITTKGKADSPIATPQPAVTAGAVDAATATPPQSDTLWRLLTGGYDFEYVNQLDSADRNKSGLIDRATKNWQQVCAEIAAAPVPPPAAQKGPAT